MRDAIHVVEKIQFSLPNSASKDEVANLKKLADKGLFKCPYCEAKLIVKSGETVILHFSHLHSEACEESKTVDKAEKKYSKQVERETEKHPAMVSIVLDELLIQSRLRTDVQVEHGYKAKPDLLEFPDIWVQVSDKEFAISIVTNVHSSGDERLAKRIVQRHHHFLEHGMQPIWFIENKELVVEKEKHAIVLWDAEAVIALKTEEDLKWEASLSDIATDLSFFDSYNYIPYMKEFKIDVKSMYYIYSIDDRISVKVQRFLSDRDIKPYRSFLLNQGYEIPFADALKVNKEFALSNLLQDELQREDFIKNNEALLKKLVEEAARQNQEEEDRLKELKRLKAAKEERIQEIKNLIKERLQHDKLSYSPHSRTLSYTDLKTQLRARIGLTQSQQMDLWTNYMLRRVGVGNSHLVWDIVEENNVTTYTELKRLLDEL
ncbi:competence protein CoiA family protein [Neobacillus sp. PS3-34]|uniref:competence protein CoiA family protein n=1 Tax=Neobacillus sp. PS3-34 TaxID=3070678 RepID=UPI0027DFEC49|nr:competence protein CoiA family protein [Neobacillus sp. PS3-34]WML46695.1 competence protein CoiA family protein [Neobacillus sp. PS3-34]